MLRLPAAALLLLRIISSSKLKMAQQRTDSEQVSMNGDNTHDVFQYYRVLQNNWQTLAAYNWDIIWSFLVVFVLFWLSNMGDFSLWYSLGIGMRKNNKIIPKNVSQKGLQSLTDVLQHPVGHLRVTVGHPRVTMGHPSLL